MKKVLLKTNELELSIQRKKVEEATKSVNSFIKKAEAECKTEFSKEEKEEIINNGVNFLTSWIKAKYQFPEASDKFNQDALGINVQDLLKNYPSIFFQRYKFKVGESGEAELAEIPHQIEACYKYAETPEQLEALKFAEKLSKMLNEACEKGFLDNRTIHNVQDLGNILSSEKVPGSPGQSKVVPNKERIANWHRISRS